MKNKSLLSLALGFSLSGCSIVIVTNNSSTVNSSNVISSTINDTNDNSNDNSTTNSSTRVEEKTLIITPSNFNSINELVLDGVVRN